MNPLEIVARTPKNNCRECGYPTCLAFGVAVSSTGVDPRKCPYIDLAGLKIRAAGIAPEDASRQRDLALVEHLKGKISGVDLAATAARLGATWQPAESALLFKYLGQEVRLNREGIRLDGRVPEDPRDQILLYNYVHSGGGQAPAGEWLGLESLPNSISKVRTLATYCEEPLARLFSGRSLTEIEAGVSKAGGHPIGNPTATLAFLFPVLPMVPEQVLFWEAEPEEGFAPRVKVLFDQKVMDFLDIESLVFSGERLAERLTVLLA
jgi:hypothetical protein